MDNLLFKWALQAKAIETSSFAGLLSPFSAYSYRELAQFNGRSRLQIREHLAVRAAKYLRHKHCIELLEYHQQKAFMHIYNPALRAKKLEEIDADRPRGRPREGGIVEDHGD
jgi:hypothetical protein